MNRPFSFRALGLALAAGILLAASGCGGDSGSGAGSGGGTPTKVSIALRNDVDSFDPFTSIGDSGAKQMFDAIYDTLIRVSPDGEGKVAVKSSLAEKWDVRPDSATFTLRHGLTCSDGSPLTASGIAKSLQHLNDPKTGSIYASRIFGPAGAKTITGDDTANTVKIVLKAPYTYLLLGLSQGYVVCPPALANLKALAGAPAPTGPYMLADSERGERYVLKRRDSVVVDNAALPDEIEMRVVADDTTRANLIATKQVDIASILGRDAARLKANSKPVVGAAHLSSALLFNQKPGLPGASKEIRRALAFAVDPAAYAKAATFDLGEGINTEYTPNMDCYDAGNKDLAPAYSLDDAKAALAAAGYGPGGKELTIRVVGGEWQNSGPELVADSFRKLGVKVEFFKGTLAQIIPIVFGTGDWDAAVYTYEVVTPVPSALVNQIQAAGNITNPAYYRLAAQAAATDGPQKCELWSKAEAALLTNVDIRPLAWLKGDWFTNNDLTFDANYYYVDTRTIRYQ